MLLSRQRVQDRSYTYLPMVPTLRLPPPLEMVLDHYRNYIDEYCRTSANLNSLTSMDLVEMMRDDGLPREYHLHIVNYLQERKAGLKK